MLHAALKSAFAVCPQVMQRKNAWLSRFSALTDQQTLHRSDVYAALTFTTRPGALP
jgi:hypothetical protein